MTLRILVLSVITVCLTNELNAQAIDDHLCWKYFKLTDGLRKGDPISKEDWNKFLDDEAIEVYMKDQGIDTAFLDTYRKTMEVVYMPQNESILKSRLKDPNKYWWTYIVNEYKIHEQDMKAYLTKIRQNPNGYLDTCYEHAYKMLPKKAHKRVDNYKLSIIPLHTDAHIESGWMVCTLMCAYFNDKNKTGILIGHELHHALRPRYHFTPDKEDEVIIEVLQRILNEGSADLVDKGYQGEDAYALLEFQRGYPENFLEEGPKVLSNIDSLLTHERDERSLTLKELLNTWNTSGHIPGYYMMNVIERNGYKEELINHISSPFFYVYLYNKAAKLDKESAFILSDTTIKYIKFLDDKYKHAGSGYSVNR
ncbi:hypothetical protein H8S90_03365 [Olivibacter sp. SDN3]|uniref:DUF5700 domain-containing putative Zn-dependent protease n=1 Tax=Olivibacter sp. SDN3 TaxID=2764720 RepID=UPI00165166C9|nr:DUF5700 domain-containing putative Zn-dependent protease [Olivibacter sp. SDN3]QNL50653.1 hypothetical protein H8S90_03365 [Olivibacter sp. SDN3]